MAYLKPGFGVMHAEKFDANRLIGVNSMYNKMKVGAKTLKDDVALTALYPAARAKKIDKERVERAIENNNVDELRVISNLFFKKSGIYSRLCRYMAYLYRYDLFVTPIVYDDKLRESKPGKIIEGWYKSCKLLENCRLKKSFGSIALKVMRQGCYYGYKLEQRDAVYLQELPVDYCRSRYQYNGKPAVEFNVKFFDDCFSDNDYRLRVVKMFPKEIQKAYVAYKKGDLPKDMRSDDRGWVLLDPNMTVKFNLGDSDVPMFSSVIPHLIDLEDAQDLDKKKMMQQIMKIIIQKFPLNKNGEIIFDVDDMNAFHNMAVSMIGDTIGVDVLSTLADIQVADMSDKGNINTSDQLEKVERSVYNEAGVPQAMFNTSGNLALEKSVINDESSVLDLIYQFQDFAQTLLAPFNKNPKELIYSVQILPTTGYNYKDLSKMYKEQTMIGFSKLLPQVALGQAQSSIIATAYFENQMLELDQVFVAPQMSSTMSSDGSKSATTNGGNGQDDKSDSASNQDVEKTVKGPSDSQGGRPELDDGEKSDKTIANQESM